MLFDSSAVSIFVAPQRIQRRTVLRGHMRVSGDFGENQWECYWIASESCAKEGMGVKRDFLILTREPGVPRLCQKAESALPTAVPKLCATGLCDLGWQSFKLHGLGFHHFNIASSVFSMPKKQKHWGLCLDFPEPMVLLMCVDLSKSYLHTVQPIRGWKYNLLVCLEK